MGEYKYKLPEMTEEEVQAMAESGDGLRGGSVPVSRKATDMVSTPTLKVPTATQKVPTATQKVPTAAYTGSTWDELEDYIGQRMKATVPESDADRRKRERRERAEGIVSGIADMGAALGNLYFASKGAPNMYDAANGLSEKARERFERAKADRERREDRWLNYALMRKKLQDERLKEARARVLESRQDEAYQYELSRRPHQEQLQDENLKRMSRANARDVMYEELADLQERYNAGEISQDELRRQQSEIYNAYHGKYGYTGTTYSRTTGPRGTTTTVRTHDAGRLQNPVSSTAPTSTSTGRGSGMPNVEALGL